MIYRPAITFFSQEAIRILTMHILVTLRDTNIVAYYKAVSIVAKNPIPAEEREQFPVWRLE